MQPRREPAPAEVSAAPARARLVGAAVPSDAGEPARVNHRMSLQWYPGHMTKARRELAALMPSQDVVIEVLDARLPAASANPVVTELRGAKPCIKVLAKSDLADPDVTRAWLRVRSETDPWVAAFASTTERPGDARKRIVELCRASRPRGPDKAGPRAGRRGSQRRQVDADQHADGPRGRPGRRQAGGHKAQQTSCSQTACILTDTPA